jgi:hypothetical protein
MLKDTTYQQKFAMLKSWMPVVADAIKKDLKNEVSRQNSQFVKAYFGSKNASKLTAEELSEGYIRAIAEHENGEVIAEWIGQRWLLKKPDLYGFFEKKLSAINPQFDQIEEIEPVKAKEIISEAIKQFGAPDTYIFSVINAVVFSKNQFDELAHAASTHVQHKAAEMQSSAEEKSTEKLIQNYELQIARLTDKYEKKLQGFERKYLCDTEGLKKQIGALQKQLNARANS